MATVAVESIERGFIFHVTGFWGCWLAAGARTMHRPASAAVWVDFPDSEASGCRAPLVTQADTSGSSPNQEKLPTDYFLSSPPAPLPTEAPILTPFTRPQRKKRVDPGIWLANLSYLGLGVEGWVAGRSEKEEEINVTWSLNNNVCCVCMRMCVCMCVCVKQQIETEISTCRPLPLVAHTRWQRQRISGEICTLLITFKFNRPTHLCILERPPALKYTTPERKRQKE